VFYKTYSVVTNGQACSVHYTIQQNTKMLEIQIVGERIFIQTVFKTIDLFLTCPLHRLAVVLF